MDVTGTVVIAGRSYPVTRLALRDGMLLITATGTGPSPAMTDVPVTVFGADGQGVCQGWHLSLPETARGQHVTIHLPVRIDTLESEPGQMRVSYE